MLSSIASSLRCPRCCSLPLRTEAAGLICASCRARFPVIGGVLDMAGDDSHEVITPFQRLMQTRWIALIYEHLWRRLGYFAASWRSFDKEMATVLGLSRGQDTRLVLDLACGPGIFTRPLAAQAEGTVVGLDLSWPMLKHAQRELEKTSICNILLIRGSALRIPFADGSVSFVNCCGALHLFDKPYVALQEIARILPKGGCLSVQTTIRPNRSVGLAYFLERFIRFGFFDEQELKAMLKKHGFEIISSERHRISYTFLAAHI